MESKVAKITHATTSGNLLFNIPANVIAYNAYVFVTEAWGAGATITVGSGSTLDRYIALGDADLTVIGAYSNVAIWSHENTTQVLVHIAHAASATGEAYVAIGYIPLEDANVV